MNTRKIPECWYECPCCQDLIKSNEMYYEGHRNDYICKSCLCGLNEYLDPEFDNKLFNPIKSGYETLERYLKITQP